MNSVGVHGQSNVSAGVDEQPGSPVLVLSSQLVDGFARESFQLAGSQIFFAQLNEIDAAARSFVHFVDELPVARHFASGELRAVGDVVEEQDVEYYRSATGNSVPTALGVVSGRFPGAERARQA